MMQKYYKHFHDQITKYWAVINIMAKETHHSLDILLTQSYAIMFHVTGFLLMKLNHIYLIISTSLAYNQINVIVTGGKKKKFFLGHSF